MKSTSVFGAFAVAAIALICAVGPGAASATAFCATQKENCPSPLPVGTKISGALQTGKNFVIENELGFVTCTKSTITGAVTETGGKGVAVTARFSRLDAENCTRPNGGGTEPCTVKQIHLMAGMTEEWLGLFAVESPWKTGDGYLGLYANALGEPGWYVKCGANIDCTFTGGTSSISMGFAGNPSPVVALFFPMNTAGTTCPKKIPTATATWRLSAPAPLYLSVM